VLSTLTEKRQHAIAIIREHFNSLPNDCFIELSDETIPDKKTLIPNIAGWKSKIEFNQNWIEIIITLTSHFPNRVPRIYLEKPPYLIPHMTPSRDNHICIVDHATVYLDTSKPLKIVLESISIAADIIKKGINKLNNDEFIREFMSYWRLEDCNESWLSLITPNINALEVKCIQFFPPLGKASILVTENEKRGLNWLQNINRKSETVGSGLSTQKNKIIQGLYIPLNKAIYHPFPRNNYELYKLLKENISLNSLSKLNNLLTKSIESRVLIIFSFEDSKNLGQFVFGGIIVSKGRLTNSKKPILNGFRNNKIPAKLQMLSVFGEKNISKAIITRVDNDRLQKRIGNSNMSSLNAKTIAIIGCGSIGSRIAMAFALNGIEKLILIDHDNLEAENIPRHICSMESIGTPKVIALELHIKKRMPHVKILSESRNCIDILSDNPNLLTDSDLVVSATGDKTFNVMLNDLRLPMATLYSWIEINGYASHSIFINPKKGGCFACTLDESMNNIDDCISSPSEIILQQEAGCGSVFLPFGSIASDTAASFSTRLGLLFLMGEISNSEKWIFYGDLQEALKKNLSLSISTSKSFSLSQNKIYRKLTCKICKKET